MAQIPQPAAADADDPRAQPSPGAYLGKADIVWMTLLAVVVAVNFWFGFHNHGEAHQVATIKANAEDLVKWLGEKSEAREQGGSILAGCDTPKDSWHGCLAAIIAPGGPFEAFRNHLEPSGKVFSDSCDRSDLKTLGAIVIERGNPKPLDPSALVYTKMPPHQDLNGKLPLKIFICGRSFHPMNVGETLF